MKDAKVKLKTSPQIDTRTKVTVGLVIGTVLVVIGSLFASTFLIRTAHFLISW